jgi:hypothetical protein
MWLLLSPQGGDQPGENESCGGGGVCVVTICS